MTHIFGSRAQSARAQADAAPSSAPLPVLDGWTLVAPISEGRWTRVFRARPADCPDDWPADYAIKLLRAEHQHNHEAVRRLEREAALGKQINHPNLVPVLSARIRTAPSYLVMPYLQGDTLAAWIVKGWPGCLPQALWIARQVAEALMALHDHNLMHADVKPSNILVSPASHAVLIDLGFARPFQSPQAPDAELVGTLNYAAPEVFAPARGRDGQSDIYSLGVVLYEMLTGHLPFQHEDPTQLALMHLRQPPPDPRRSNPGLPPQLVRLLERMLAKEPLRRPTARELVAQLMDLELETFDEWFAVFQQPSDSAGQSLTPARATASAANAGV